MPTAWSDTKTRIVSLNVFEKRLDEISGTCHRFHVSRLTSHRVYVEYSNPNEYGSEFPMIAVYPCYKSGNFVSVVAEILNVVHDNWNGEGWQAFDQIFDFEEHSVNPNE